MNVVDCLIKKVIVTKNPTVVGLDPDIRKIPSCYKEMFNPNSLPLQQVSEVLYEFNKDIIDTVYELIPAVKPQMAFYEKYGSQGVLAFEMTVQYAREKGLIVIEDGKRNDIGNTAEAYASGHLGRVETISGELSSSFDVDFLTVTPFLGSESLSPFINVCKDYNKGLFILVKTSNVGSGEIQDATDENGNTVCENLAYFINNQTKLCIGDRGYSSIGAVVGATYPEEAKKLRSIMPKSYFLVPGFGAQGAGIDDVMPCFNSDGLGALINSSRGILYNHMTEEKRKTCTRQEYLSSVLDTVIKMQKALYDRLKDVCNAMVY